MEVTLVKIVDKVAGDGDSLSLASTAMRFFPGWSILDGMRR